MVTLSEETFRQQVRRIARMYGWEFQYHTHNSQRSDAGWPDEVFIHPRYLRAIFVELKSDKGKPTAGQKRWLAALAGCGLEVAIWWPKDMDHIIDVLGPRQLRCQLPPL